MFGSSQSSPIRKGGEYNKFNGPTLKNTNKPVNKFIKLTIQLETLWRDSHFAQSAKREHASDCGHCQFCFSTVQSGETTGISISTRKANNSHLPKQTERHVRQVTHYYNQLRPFIGHMRNNKTPVGPVPTHAANRSPRSKPLYVPFIHTQ